MGTAQTRAAKGRCLTDDPDVGLGYAYDEMMTKLAE